RHQHQIRGLHHHRAAEQDRRQIVRLLRDAIADDHRAGPADQEDQPSKLSRVRCSRTGLAMKTSVASNDASIVYSIGSNSSDDTRCMSLLVWCLAAWRTGSMTIGIQNDSATPRAVACAIVDDANTIRCSTMCMLMKPSNVSAS